MVLWTSLFVAVNLAGFPEPTTLDHARITEHLQRTEHDLRAKDVSDLSLAQQTARAENLDALHRYWVRGVYPHNTYVPGVRVPVFIDADGRACAVGQLMIDSGAEVLAQHIAMDERLEYLATIETQGVEHWIEASGLTFDELARIQPSYCGCGDQGTDPVCGVDGETYPNACMATQCAGVEIEHDGPCEGNSESGDGETEGATSGGAGSSSSGETGSDEEGGTPETQSQSSGCSLGGGSAASLWCVLVLGWRRRR